MSTQVWTLIIDFPSEDEHGVEVFASYREALAVLPARLSHEWARYVHEQQKHGLGYDEANFLDWLPEVGSTSEVVIEAHELAPVDVPPRLAPGEYGQQDPTATVADEDQVLDMMTLHELRALARAGLHLAAAYGQDPEPPPSVVFDVLSESLGRALPSWVPTILDSEDVPSMNWWRRMTGKEQLPEDEDETGHPWGR